MKYAIFKHTSDNLGLLNIGDHIQTCAAEQFMPKIDSYVDRDELNTEYSNQTKIIMNGWFTSKPQNWPPNENLIPLFISFHLQPKSAKVILSKKENVEYLKKHSPIGCRDYKTVDILQEHGIEAYFSFCLTTTLDINYKSKTRTNKIYIVDTFYGYDSRHLLKMNPWEIIKKFPIEKIVKLKDYFNLKKPNINDLIPQTIIKNAISINHYITSKKTNIELYELAKNYLKKYAEAKLVITSRIHCALPCLALGTPVLFVMEGLEDEKLHMSRFRGILDHINILTTEPKEKFQKLFNKEMNVYSPNEINWDNPPQNPNTHIHLAEELKLKCQNFINADL